MIRKGRTALAEENNLLVRARFIAPLRQSLPPTASMIVLTCYLLLNLGCVLLMANSLILGIMGVLAINLLQFLFLRPLWVVPLYILIAGPSVSLPLGSAGIFSRLFGGNLLFALVVVIGLMRTMIPGPSASVPETMHDVKLIVRAFIGVGMLYALGTIFAGPLGLLSLDAVLGYRRPLVFGETSSILGMLLVLFTCIALGQALYARKLHTALGWWFCTLIFSCAVIMTFGRESWIGLGLSVVGMIGFRTRNLSILFIIQVFLILLFIPGVSDFFNPAKVYGIDRLNIWQDAIAIWQRHPYFGIGAGNYQFFDIAYGTDVAGVAHNQFLEVLAEMGVQGLLCLLWSLYAIARFTWQCYSAATARQGKAIGLAYIGYFITIIFGGFFTGSFLPSVAGAGGTYSMLWVSYPWLLLGLVLTIPRWEQSACAQDLLEPGRAVE